MAKRADSISEPNYFPIGSPIANAATFGWSSESLFMVPSLSDVKTIDSRINSTVVQTLADELVHDLNQFGDLTPANRKRWQDLGRPSDPWSKFQSLMPPSAIDLSRRRGSIIGPYVQSVAQSLNLPPTADLDELIQLYRRKYYSGQCLIWHQPEFCWDDAIQQQNVEMIRKILKIDSSGDRIQSGFEESIRLNRPVLVNLFLDIIVEQNARGQISPEYFQSLIDAGVYSASIHDFSSVLESLLTRTIPSIHSICQSFLAATQQQFPTIMMLLLPGIMKCPEAISILNQAIAVSFATPSILRSLIDISPDSNLFLPGIKRALTRAVANGIDSSITILMPFVSKRTIARHLKWALRNNRVATVQRLSTYPKILTYIIRKNLKHAQWSEILKLAQATGKVSPTNSIGLFEWAAAIGSKSLLKALNKRMEVDTPLVERGIYIATKYGHSKTVKYLRKQIRT